MTSSAMTGIQPLESESVGSPSSAKILRSREQVFKSVAFGDRTEFRS